MPCNFYNTNGLGTCAGCCHFNKSLAITLVGTVLQIQIGPQILKNGEKVCVALCQNIPEVTADTTVSIVITGDTPVNVPVYLHNGNRLYADQLRARKVLHLFTATDSPFFIVSCHDVCGTEHSFPTINTTV